MTLEELICELQKIDDSNKEREISITAANSYGAINSNSNKVLIKIVNGKLNLTFAEED